MSISEVVQALIDEGDFEAAEEYLDIQDRLSSLFVPLPHQQAPEGTDWDVWLLMGGRGIGKTDAAAHYVNEHVNGPPCFSGGHRVGIIAPTLGDALDSCVNGPTGLKAHNPDVRSIQGTGGTHVHWPNGSQAKLFGAHTPEDIERLRAGGNRCLDWFEELAAWRHISDCYQQARFGRRLGKRPHAIGSTTPKPRQFLIDLLKNPKVVVTRAKTSDNPYLEQSVRDALYEAYGGTRIGRQELEGELLEDVEGALWKYDIIAKHRVSSAPDLARVAVSVDPSGGSGENNDEQGIIITGRGVDAEGYVIGDRSCKLSPNGWGRRAVQAYLDFEADVILGEKNFGGEMVEHVVSTAARDMGVKINFDYVKASRGKVLRAEPVVALYEQGKVHHVGALPELEEQLTRWTPIDGTSPDRLDAAVHGLTELMLGTPKRTLRYRGAA